MRRSAKGHAYTRVSAIDASYAHDPVWVIVGPTEVVDSAGYLAALRSIASGGVAQRVGLIPSPDTVYWRVEDVPSEDMVWDGLPVDVTDIDTLLSQLVRLQPKEPIYASNCDRYLQLRMDHGLGDAWLMCEIVAALTRIQDRSTPGFIEPKPVPNLAKPLIALVKSILLHHAPSQVALDFTRELRRRARKQPLSGPRVTDSSRMEPYRVAFVRSAPHFLAELRQFRNEHHPGVSTSTIMFHAFRQAACASGISLTDSMSVLTDLRRYLAQDLMTLANMSIVAHIVASDNQTVEELGQLIQKELASTYPATRAVGWAALWAVRRRVGNSQNSGSASASKKVGLTLSDVTRLPGLTKIGFSTESVDRLFAVVLPPGDQNQISVCFSRVGDQLHVTATYYPDVVDHDAIEETLRRVVTLQPPGERA